MGLQKSVRYSSFLVWSGSLAKSRARTTLEELNCIELVVMVNWDDDIDNAIVAVDMDAPDLIDLMVSWALLQYARVYFL
jgi:hypothetical protein